MEAEIHLRKLIHRRAICSPRDKSRRGPQRSCGRSYTRASMDSVFERTRPRSRTTRVGQLGVRRLPPPGTGKCEPGVDIPGRTGIWTRCQSPITATSSVPEQRTCSDGNEVLQRELRSTRSAQRIICVKDRTGFKNSATYSSSSLQVLPSAFSRKPLRHVHSNWMAEFAGIGGTADFCGHLGRIRLNLDKQSCQLSSGQICAVAQDRSCRWPHGIERSRIPCAPGAKVTTAVDVTCEPVAKMFTRSKSSWQSSVGNSICTNHA